MEVGKKCWSQKSYLVPSAIYGRESGGGVCTKKVVGWILCCVSVVVSRDDMEAAAVETVHFSAYLSFSIQASHEWVRVEHTAVWCSLIFMCIDSR